MTPTRILNVDDNEINRYIRSEVLRHAGYLVSEATNGAEALEQFAAVRPHLVLLDINMPDLLGTEVCRRIKAQRSSLAVVILHISATSVASEDQVTGLENGADGYLCEPVEPALLLATIRSMLRLRAAEIEARENGERLTLAQEVAGLSFWDWDVRSNAVVRSAQEFRHYGLEPDHGPPVSIPDWFERVHPEDRETSHRALERTIDTGDPYDAEFRVIWPDQSVHWLSVKARAFRDEEGQPVRVIGTTMDITARKAVDEELRRTNLALARSNEDLKSFTFSVSHDLQEPLRTVGNYAELLARKHGGSADSETRSYVEILTSVTARMQDLVKDLLAFAQVQLATMAPLSPVSSDGVVRFVLAGLETSIRETGAVITFEHLPMVNADAVQLAQVFQNLIGNAIKYRKPDQPPQIRIVAERSGTECTITVADNGIGFRQEYADRIFLALKRLHGREVPGSGMGLAIAKKIVERHGGRIWAESTPGQGARFSFTLLEVAGSKSHKAG